MLDAATGTEISSLDHDDQVLAVAFSPDGTRVATASCDESGGGGLWCAAPTVRIEHSVARRWLSVPARLRRPAGCLTAHAEMSERSRALTRSNCTMPLAM